MKVRIGLVSNSSSSSFIIRGIKIKTDEAAKLLNININNDLCETYDKICKKIKGLTIESTDYYFDDPKYKEIIIGKKICSLNDGEVSELPDITLKDKDIQALLKQNGLPNNKELKVYIQYVSNDNF